jgi:hypothetical protein
MSDFGEPGSPSEALLRMAHGAEPISDLVARAEDVKKERESEEATAELFEACPLLRDINFVNSHPGIVPVARYLYFNLKSVPPRMLRTFGAESIQDWLEQLQRGKQRAVRDYQSFRGAYA